MNERFFRTARWVWRRLPMTQRLRILRTVTRLTDLARLQRATPAVSGAPAAEAPRPEVIRDLTSLDRKLRELDAANAVSDDELRRQFKTFTMAFPLPLPDDPYGDEYRERQLEVYAYIAGRTYATANEASPFNMSADRPFPYYTESWDTVSNQLTALGHIIRTMALPPRARILEFGPGWGNTTVTLARMGYDVTAVDVEQRFLDLIAERARRINLTTTLVRGGFLDAELPDGLFDAVLFFECFHHCSDHVALLRRLKDLIKPEGRVYFAAEPIAEEFPMPWGLRLDGESLWAIRGFGWLELGYQESYFLRTLLRLGWVATRQVASDTCLGVIHVARRAFGEYRPGKFRLPPDEERTWAAAETDPDLAARHTTDRSILTIEHGAVFGRIVVDIENAAPFEQPCAVTFGVHAAERRLPPRSRATLTLPYDPAGDRLEIRTRAWVPAEVLGSADHRILGLAVHRIVLDEAPPDPP